MIMERTRIIAAFGDIRGFRKWTVRALNAPEVASLFIDEVYRSFEAFEHESATYVKFLGDGLMIVRELSTGHNCGTARRFLQELDLLNVRVHEAIKNIYPRPDGFRVRAVSGHVWKRQTVCGGLCNLMKRAGRKVHKAEFIGYPVNMAQSLLFVYPEIPTVCHESVVELMGTKTCGLSLKQLPAPKEPRYGVDPQDFHGLWSFRATEKNKTVAQGGIK